MARRLRGIDPKHTLVEFGVKHMMSTAVKGRFTGVRGTTNCADEADAASVSVEAEIDAASVNTGEEQRDAHLRSVEFPDAERYRFGLTWNAALESSGLLVGNKFEIVIKVQALRKS